MAFSLRGKGVSRGFTLWEMLVALGILAALIAAASPGFSAARRDSVLTASVNQMVAAIHFARSSSILANAPAVICLSSDGVSCISGTGQSARGWLIFYERQWSGTPEEPSGNAPLRTVDLPRDVLIRGTRTALIFWPTARSGTTGTFTFCWVREPESARAVVVSQTGRPRIAPDAAAAVSKTGCRQ